MAMINQLLQDYHIVPSEVTPITNRLFKVHSHQNTYALKRSKLDETTVEKWKSVYQTANQQQLHGVLPVYMTKSGDIYKTYNKEVYYLTPWKEKRDSDEPEHEVESFYQAIATIHSRTKEEKQVSIDLVEQAVQREKEQIEQYRDQWIKYVETFEQRHYMSPFELRVCMQFRDIEHVFKQLEGWYDSYLEDVANDEKVISSLCHGNLKRSHKVYQRNETFLINWENAYIGSPINDLANYFYHDLKYHDSYLDYMIQSFSIYEKYNPLLQSERSLLAIQLLNPSTYLHVLNSYYHRAYNQSHPFQVKYLEYAYRRLVHALKVQSHFYQVRQDIKNKELESDN